jgi:hypothetical protein
MPSLTAPSGPVRTVTQGVVLVGAPGSGKGQVMQGVQRLAFLVDPGAIVSGFRSADGLSNAARRHPGLMWMLQDQDHPLLARLAPDDKGNPSHLAVALQYLQLDQGGGPFRPITLLTETTPAALRKEKLPDWFALSPFYGSLLFAVADVIRPPLRHDYVGQPSAALVDRLRGMTALRRSPESVPVTWRSPARELYREILLKAVSDIPLGPVWAHRTLNLAALVAISVDPVRPVIEEDHVVAASEPALNGFEVMKSGLRQAHARGLN